ncbi:MAG: hypothetical protein KAX50_04480 [Saprospiraceae bacterium]|nr:hypothetical protein [Saprospiraceae bacterium]
MNGVHDLRFFDKTYANQGVNWRICINEDSNEIDLRLDKVSSQSVVEIKAGKTVQQDFIKNYLAPATSAHSKTPPPEKS